MLTRQEAYKDLGATHFDTTTRARTANRLLKRLKDIGLEVVQLRVLDSLPPGDVSL